LDDEALSLKMILAINKFQGEARREGGHTVDVAGAECAGTMIDMSMPLVSGKSGLMLKE
jgi:hypothetical protein